MTKKEKNWIIDIQNTAEEIAFLYVRKIANHMFKKYGATSIRNLAPCYFSEIFDELDFIASNIR